MLAATAFIGCSLVSYLSTYRSLKKNIIAIRKEVTPTIIQKKKDILYAAERIQLMTYDVAAIRCSYQKTAKNLNITDAEIDEILQAGDSEIDKANLVEKMVALYRKHKLDTFESSIDDALDYAFSKTEPFITEIGGPIYSNDIPSFKRYLLDYKNAQNYLDKVDSELQPALLQLKDAYKEAVVYREKAPIHELMIYCAKQSALMLASAAACYYGPLTSALSNQEYAKIGGVVLAASTTLLLSGVAMQDILDNNPIYSMKHRCNTKLCAERVTPHPEHVLIMIASTAASVAAGHYVAALM